MARRKLIPLIVSHFDNNEFVIFCLGCTAEYSIVVCVSPLNSLMMDQRHNFSSYGISVEFVGESQHDGEVIKNVANGRSVQKT